MAADAESFEEELRSRMYTALVDLAWARAEDKLAIVERLITTSNQLKDLIMHGKIPEM
jgi:hypothetical protein